MMEAAILGLGTAVPEAVYLQEEVADKFSSIFSLNDEKSDYLKKLYQNSAIHQRHSVLADFHKPREEWDFWGADYPKTVPSMGQRNQVYKREAPKLAIESARNALQAWGGDPQQLTHLISISCTGMVAPGIEFDLMRDLKLNFSINRLGINFMGCFGAFKGLSVARAFAKENPTHRILVVCTELCSLHLQATLDIETLVGNSIFADGSAAVIIGGDPQKNETPLWNIAKTKSMGLANSLDKMSWEAGDTGYLMRLSPKVPVLLGRHIQPFIEKLLINGLLIEACDWPIHPGGKSILQAIEKALQLDKSQTQASWDILANYGNMSSATFLFVLDRLSKQKPKKEWAVGMAFGPGLSMEGVLLKSC